MCIDNEWLPLCLERICRGWWHPSRTGFVVSSSDSRTSYSELRELLRDGLYELDALPEGGRNIHERPSVEFVFFHGIQLENPRDGDVFTRTWRSKDDSEFWPMWLKDQETLPNARILITSYDAWAQRNSTQARFDLPLLAENLLTELMMKGVGQHGCPVILVGHCIGCLVIKAICQRAHHLVHLGNSHETQQLQYFLTYTRGMFFFSPPSLGADFAAELLSRIASPGPLLKILKLLNDDVTRAGEDFMKVRRKYGWKTRVVADTQPVQLQIALQSGSVISFPLQIGKRLQFRECGHCAEEFCFSSLRIKMLRLKDTACDRAYQCLILSNSKTDSQAGFKFQVGKPFECEYMGREGCSRYDADNFLPIEANYFSISRLSDRSESSYDFLVAFVKDLCADPQIIGQDIQSMCKAPEDLSGLDHRLEELEEWLSRENGLGSPDLRVRYIGLVGVGGIGKTTLAKSFLAKQYFGTPGECTSEGFEYSCMWNAAVSNGTPDLQRNLLSEMFRWGKKMPSTLELKWCALKGKKVLILLDDVQDMCHILQAGINHGLGPGSLVMATSRDRAIPQKAGYRIYEVKTLDDIFSRKFLDDAFGQSRSRSIYGNFVSDIMHVCGGLPLALAEVIKYLKNKTTERSWEGTIARVKLADPGCFDCSSKNRLWASLTRSYEELADSEKEMFVDLATCFNGEEAEEVVAAWKAVYTDGYSGCWNLLNKSMVKCTGDFGPISVTGEYSWFVKGTRLKTKHKLLTYLGKRLKHEDDDKYQRQRTVHVFDKPTFEKLRDLEHRSGKQAIREKILIMKIDGWHRSLRTDVNLNLLTSFDNLRVLWLTKVSLSDERAPHDFEMLRSMGSLLWKQSNGDGISSLVSCSSLKHLHCSGEFGDWSGNAPNSTFSLICTSALSTYQNLEHLVLNSLDMEELPDCFDNLQKLHHLEISNCSMVKSLPFSFTRLVRVRRLFLIGLESLAHLPESFESFNDLKQFELRKCIKLTNFKFLGTIQYVEHLALEELQLENLPNDQPLQNLQCFEVSRCRNLTTLPSWLASEAPNLQHLKLIELNNLGQDNTILLDTVKLRLQTLKMSDCSVPAPQTSNRLVLA